MVTVMRVSARVDTPAGAVVFAVAMEAGAMPMTVSLNRFRAARTCASDV